MPIRREHRHFYPIDWPQLSAVIRFVRARSRCEGCGRPHMQDVQHLGDGRWWDAEAVRWRDGRGRLVRRALPAPEGMAAGLVKITRVVLATAHRNHDTADNADGNLAALCQRCHMLHDRPEHQRRRRITLRARKALGDLFSRLFPARDCRLHVLTDGGVLTGPHTRRLHTLRAVIASGPAGTPSLSRREHRRRGNGIAWVRRVEDDAKWFVSRLYSRPSRSSLNLFMLAKQPT